MKRNQKIPWLRLFAEGSAIVVSILLAFAIQAWWDTRLADQQRIDHLVALGRDFEQMAQRADESYFNAERAYNAGVALLNDFAQAHKWEPEAAIKNVQKLVSYEVFSPSTGSYESIVSSGAIELLKDSELKRDLAAFFGSFDDTRASEQTLLAQQDDFVQSGEFAHFVGVYRLPIPKFPAANDPPLAEWRESEVLRNWIALISLAQKDVMEDYKILRDQISRIRVAIRKATESG